jgi:phosphohistidine phosphatase
MEGAEVGPELARAGDRSGGAYPSGMWLFVVRHGKAERDSPTGRDDDRPLSPRGIRQARWLGQHIGEHFAKHRPDLILASPIVRALDTARILHQALRAPLEVADGLSTHADASAALSLVQSRAALGSFMIVGHNPTFEMVVGALLKPTSRPGMVMRTGECAVIKFAKGSGLLGDGKLVAMLRDEIDED